MCTHIIAVNIMLIKGLTESIALQRYCYKMYSMTDHRFLLLVDILKIKVHIKYNIRLAAYSNGSAASSLTCDDSCSSCCVNYSNRTNTSDSTLNNPTSLCHSCVRVVVSPSKHDNSVVPMIVGSPPMPRYLA